MASTDWTALTPTPDATTEVQRGATTAIARAPVAVGAPDNDFVFGFNSVVAAAKLTAFFTNQVNFAPVVAGKGMSIRGVLQRGLSGGGAGFAPFLFVGLQGTASTNNAYLLGIGDPGGADPNPPCHIILRKGQLDLGVPDVAPGSSGVLLRSTTTFQQGVWLHLRLDMIVNTNGDVLLQVFQNNLNTNPLGGPPNWQPIAGMTAQFTDDVLGNNSGSVPYTGGRLGFGFKSSLTSRRGWFDHIEALRQV